MKTLALFDVPDLDGTVPAARNEFHTVNKREACDHLPMSLLNRHFFTLHQANIHNCDGLIKAGKGYFLLVMREANIVDRFYKTRFHDSLLLVCAFDVIPFPELYLSIACGQ